MAQKISKKLSFIGGNIRKIRQVKRISQADFAIIFNLARPSIGAYEEGRSEPKIDTIIQIANYYGISIDVLLTRELTASDILSFGLLNEKLNKAHPFEGRKHQPKIPSIPFVRIAQYFDYIINHGVSEYLKNLPEVNIPYDNLSSDLRAFEMRGSEMENHQQGIHHGDILIGERVQELNKKHIGEVLTIVHKSNIFTKRLRDISKAVIILGCDAPHYEDSTIPIVEIIETWNVKLCCTRQLRPPTLVEERIQILEKEINLLKNNTNTSK